MACFQQRPGVHLACCMQVMEYCDRGTLQEAISRGVFVRGPNWNDFIARRAVLRTAAEVAKALMYLHSKDIVHGDLVRVGRRVPAASQQTLTDAMSMQALACCTHAMYTRSPPTPTLAVGQRWQ